VAASSERWVGGWFGSLWGRWCGYLSLGKVARFGGGGCLPTWHWTSRNIMCARAGLTSVREGFGRLCWLCALRDAERFQFSASFRSTTRGRLVTPISTPIPGFTRFCSFAEIWFAEIWFSHAELSKKPIGKLRSVASKGPDRARGMPSGHTPYTARTVAAASGSTGGKWYNVVQRKYRSARHAPTHSPLSRDQQPPRSAPGTHSAQSATRVVTPLAS